MASIVDHPAWPLLQPYVNDQQYGRDTGPDGGPRHRFDVRLPASGVIGRQLLAITMPCCACQQTIHPVRPREKGGWYLAVACEQAVSFSCSRGARARDAYRRLEAAMAGYVDPNAPVQVPLW